MQESSKSKPDFRIGQRVHSSGDPRRIGMVKYVGPVQGYSGTWVGVDWDNGEGKHDGTINGVRYFQARSEQSGSFVRSQNLSSGISLLQALQLRYRGDMTKEEEDEMYVLSASNKRVNVQLVGKDKIQDKLSRLEELTSASVSYLGVSSPGVPCDIGTHVPNLKELDFTGNLISEWKDVSTICEQLPDLFALNLSYNLMAHDMVGLPHLKCILILVLNNTALNWTQVEILKQSLPEIEELHLMGNKISTIKPASSFAVQGFDYLRLLNLEDNCIADWNEILKLSQLRSLEQLHLSNNSLNRVFYPDDGMIHELINGNEEKSQKPFQNLRCLLLGGNNIEDLASIDSLNSFPQLVDIRLSENPVADPGEGGIPRFVLVARLAKVEMLNGSEVSSRERKESEIRYVRLVLSKLQGNSKEIQWLHPRYSCPLKYTFKHLGWPGFGTLIPLVFATKNDVLIMESNPSHEPMLHYKFAELKVFHGIEDEKPLVGAAFPQKMASGLLSITLKCVVASIGEKPPLTKKLPGATTVGKLKILCESFFKLKSIKLKLFLQEEGSPLPMLLDDEMATLTDLGIGNESTILVDEES